VTGLTSNPTIFDHAIKNKHGLRRRHPRKARKGPAGPRTSSSSWPSRTSPARQDLFRPINERTAGVDGWVSLEVSPLLAPTRRARSPRQGALRPGRPTEPLHKIPGTKEGVPAIEEAISPAYRSTSPSSSHASSTSRSRRPSCAASSGASTRGSSRTSGQSPRVRQPMGTPPSRQGVRPAPETSSDRDRKRTYAAYRVLLASPRWQRAFNAGARSATSAVGEYGTKDPHASDVLYVKALAAPFTVNTMPEATLRRSPSTGRSAPSCPPTAATARRCWRGSRRPHRRRRPGRPAPGRGSQGVRQIVDDLLAVITSKSAPAREGQLGNS